MPPLKNSLNSFFCADLKHLRRRRYWRKLLPSTSSSLPSSSWLPSPFSSPSSATGLPSPWMSSTCVISTHLCHLLIISNCISWHLFKRNEQYDFVHFSGEWREALLTYLAVRAAQAGTPTVQIWRLIHIYSLLIWRLMHGIVFYLDAFSWIRRFINLYGFSIFGFNLDSWF